MVKGQNLNFAIPGERVLNLKQGKSWTLSEWTPSISKEWLNTPEGLYSQGLVSLWIEDCTKALYYFSAAVTKKNTYAEAWFYVGYCNGELGRWKNAKEAYEQVIKIYPDNEAAHYNLGVVYVRLGYNYQALESFKEAIRINPDYANAHFNLGVTYSKLRRYREEIDAYKQAIRIQPDFTDAHYSLGLTYLTLGDKGSALQEYKILKDLDVDIANKLFNLIYK